MGLKSREVMWQNPGPVRAVSLESDYSRGPPVLRP
jgi:hypothetical protein